MSGANGLLDHSTPNSLYRDENGAFLPWAVVAAVETGEREFGKIRVAVAGGLSLKDTIGDCVSILPGRARQQVPLFAR